MTHAIGVLNGNFRHRWDDRDLATTGITLSIRRKLELCLELAEGMSKEKVERIADSGELLKLEYIEQLTILDAIDEKFYKPLLKSRIHLLSGIVTSSTRK